MSDELMIGGALAKQQFQKAHRFYVEIFEQLERQLQDLNERFSAPENDGPTWFAYPSDDLLTHSGQYRFHEQNAIRGSIVNMCHLWENLMTDILARELPRLLDFNRPIYLPLQIDDIAAAFDLFFEIRIDEIDGHTDVENLRLISNFIKHKNVSLLERIYQQYPSLLSDNEMRVHVGPRRLRNLVKAISSDSPNGGQNGPMYGFKLRPHPDRLRIPFEFAKERCAAVPAFFENLYSSVHEHHLREMVRREEGMQ